jgi:hypothetical protein
MAPESQTKRYKFRDFSSNFAKNTQLQLRFSQRRNKLFDFSGRFSESSNNFLSLELQREFSNLIASRRKIVSKQ